VGQSRRSQPGGVVKIGRLEPVARRREAPLLAVEIRVGVLFELKGSREQGAARWRKLGARLERRELGGLIAALFGGALVEVVMTAQPLHRTIAHALGYLADVLFRRRLCWVEAYVPKPVDPRELTTIIASLASRALQPNSP